MPIWSTVLNNSDPPSQKKMTTIKIRSGKQLMNELQLMLITKLK